MDHNDPFIKVSQILCLNWEFFANIEFQITIIVNKVYLIWFVNRNVPSIGTLRCLIRLKTRWIVNWENCLEWIEYLVWKVSLIKTLTIWTTITDSVMSNASVLSHQSPKLSDKWRNQWMDVTFYSNLSLLYR